MDQGLAEAKAMAVMQASMQLITDLFLAAYSRSEGVFITTVPDIMEPIMIDNANMFYLFLPELPAEGIVNPEGMLDEIVRASEGRYVNALDPALANEGALDAYRDARSHRSEAFRLLDGYLEKAIELAQTERGSTGTTETTRDT